MPPLPGDEDLRPSEVAAEAVRVTHRDDADPRVARGDETAAVAGRLAGAQQLYLSELRLPAQHRLQAVAGGMVAERREPVERDPAAGGVEARAREVERAGRV